MKKFLLSFLIPLLTSFAIAQNPLAIPDTLSGLDFDLYLKDTSHVFYPGTPTSTYAINGSYLGPTLILNAGDSVNMHVYNGWPDTTTIHWHGMHVAASNDGGPHTTIPPGSVWNPGFKVRDEATTFWYHPHLHMRTNLHCTRGAAGMIIVRDSVEAALALPRTYGVDDIPLVLQTKQFDANKEIQIGDALDSVPLANGTRNAFLDVPAQVVRFRLLNGSSERVFNLGLEGNPTFYQIGSDGGLLGNPVSMTRLLLAPGERAEVLVDLSGMQGQSLRWKSFASEIPRGYYGAANPSSMGMGSIPNYSLNPLNGADFDLLQLVVGAPTANPITQIPGFLRFQTPYPANAANATRSILFQPLVMGSNGMLNGPFVLNGVGFDMNTINYTIPRDNIELWTLTNQTHIAHPFHIHDIQFYITEINGAQPPANQQGRKDVILVPAMGTVKFIGKFETFCDPVPYMYHCHMLTHEDEGMMGQFVVTCPTTDLAESPDSRGGLMVFPNPSASGQFQFRFDRSMTGELLLSDAAGRVIQRIDLENVTQAQADLSRFPTGIYFFRFTSDQEQFTGKLRK